MTNSTNPDGVRRIVVLKKKKLVWHVDIGDSASDAHAKEIVTTPQGIDLPALVDQNGGGWKFDSIISEFPHEATEYRNLNE